MEYQKGDIGTRLQSQAKLVKNVSTIGQNAKRDSNLMLVMAKDILGYFWQCHVLGYFGILLAISWPRIFWDTFGNIMAEDILGYFWQYHGLGYFGTSMAQGYKRR